MMILKYQGGGRKRKKKKKTPHKKFVSLEVKLLQTGTLNVKIRGEFGAAQNHIISVKISSTVNKYQSMYKCKV